jgi:hypothetical protein
VTGKHRLWSGVYSAIFIGFLLAGQNASAQDASGVSKAPTPNWVAWRAFYQSLDFYGRRSPQQDVKIAAEQFGLSPSQAATLLNKGRSFVADIERIDSEARVVAAEKYKYVPTQSGKPAPGQPQSRPAGSQKSVRDRAIQDGFAAEVEAKKVALLAKHMNDLMQELGVGNRNQVRNFVENAIAPKIISTPAPNPNSKGNPSLPPGIKGEAPTGPITPR